MSSSAPVEIPPRPSWMRRRIAAPGVVAVADEPLPDDVRQQRLLRGIGNVSSGVLLSAAIHLTILLALNIWLFVIRPGPSGFVINCEILTEDDGAETPVNTVVQAALPDEPPPGGDIRWDPRQGSGIGDSKFKRVGGGSGGAGAGAGGGGVGFFGTKAQGESFVFVVDRSGSMSSDGRLTSAKRELNRAIGSLQPHQRFYVIFYSNAAQPMLEPRSPAGLVFALPEMKDTVRAWMRPLQAGGGTEPAGALKAALEMQPDVLFFLTDGQIPETTGETVTAANHHGTVIHTTALVSHRGETLLQEIARTNSGTYRHVGEIPTSIETTPAAQMSLKERRAEATLRLARKHLQEGRPNTSRRWLRQVIREFPGTSQAARAQQLLSSL